MANEVKNRVFEANKIPNNEVNNRMDESKKYSMEKEKDYEVKNTKEKVLCDKRKKDEVKNRATEAKKIPLN